MSKKYDKMLKVRITPENKLLIRNYKKHHPLSASIPTIVNYALMRWFISVEEGKDLL